MPLHLDPTLISRSGDRPLHRQLADVIAAAIRSGELAAGEALPPEAEIAAQMDLSSTPVRAALALLAQEGRVIKRAGMPTRVAPLVIHRHMATSRYAEEIAILEALEPGEPHPLTSAFTADHGIPWDRYVVQASCCEDVATADEAARLLIPPGSPILRRQLLKLGGDHPPQQQDSIIPLDLVRGTPVADPTREPWPGGTLAQLWSVGVRKPITVSEEAESRTATAAERETLRMDAPGPVLVVVRLFAGALLAPEPVWLLPPRPVEMSTVVLPAVGVTLAWETTLT